MPHHPYIESEDWLLPPNGPIPVKFVPTDPTTWPPLDTPVFWMYNPGDGRKYMVAELNHIKARNGAEYLKFTETSINGRERESDLDTYTPIAWQFIIFPTEHLT